MQQENNNYPIHLFKQVLEAGPLLTAQHLNNLETLLFSFPQCGMLYAIHASSGDTPVINKAAAWFGDSANLQKAVKQFESLPAVSPNQIIFKLGNASSAASMPNKEAEPLVALKLEEIEPVADAPGTAPYMEPLVLLEPEPVRPEAQITTQYFEVIEAEPEPTEAEPLHQQPVTVTEDKVPGPIYRKEPFDETQKLIIESIASNDYFVFDKAFADRNQPDPETGEVQPLAENKVLPSQPDIQLAAEDNTVTRYHDDKMPYSFMWWLDKTRNKHSSVYQPFSNSLAKVNNPQPASEKEEKEVFEERKKEEDLVERFLQEEPQIKPPDSSKLDNENKGKQSEEDHEELITETLARIYADQMLYSKAIAAYKILMLKNPEKRRYFASQIEILQKKIN